MIIWRDLRHDAVIVGMLEGRRDGAKSADTTGLSVVLRR